MRAILCLGSLALLLSGCGKPLETAVPFSAQKHPLPSIEGTWMGGCLPNAGKASQEEVQISSGSLVRTTEYFPRAECSSEDYISRVMSRITKKSIPVDGSGPIQIDLQLQKVEIAITSATQAAFWNAHKACGRTDWRAGEMRDVTGRLCWGRAIPAAGEKRYDLVEILPGGALVFGKRTPPYDAKTPEHRPRELATDRKYSRAAS